MKRCVYLLFVFLLTAGSLSAQFPQKPGDPVDYSRIQRPRLWHYPVYYIGNGGDRPFTLDDTKKAMEILRNYKAIGKSKKAADLRSAMQKLAFDDLVNISKWEASKRIQLVFNGDLIRTRDHTDEDLENAIQFALKSMSWTREDVKAAHELSNKVRSIHYSSEQFWKEIEAATGIANTAEGVQNAIAYIVGEAGTTTAEQYELQHYVPTLDLMERTDIAYTSLRTLETINTSTYDFVKSMKNAEARQKQIMKERVAEVFEKKLAQFYQLINSNLPSQRGEIWMIKLAGSVIADFTFEETLCRQVWDIKMQLKSGHEAYWKGADPKAYIDSYEGIYMGELNAHLMFYFDNYDASFIPRTEDQLFTAIISDFNLRGMGLYWMLAQEKYGGNFSHTGDATRASADHHLPIMVELKKAKRDATVISAKPKIIGDTMLTQRVPFLPPKRSTSAFRTNHRYKYTVSKDGFTYDGEAALYSKRDTTVMTEFRQELKTPPGKDRIETALLALLSGIVYANGEKEKGSDYKFRKETYPIGTIEVDLQTNAAQ